VARGFCVACFCLFYLFYCCKIISYVRKRNPAESSHWLSAKKGERNLLERMTS
jgi:hypothetical protein